MLTEALLAVLVLCMVSSVLIWDKESATTWNGFFGLLEKAQILYSVTLLDLLLKSLVFHFYLGLHLVF